MDEKLRILKMVQEGAITAEEGMKLMEAMADASQQEAVVPAISKGYEKKLLRILVDSEDGDKVKVQFPVKAVKKLLAATGKMPFVSTRMEGVDMENVMETVAQCLDEEVEGDLVNIESADGETIRIFVE